jgi:hypothetical protein
MTTELKKAEIANQFLTGLRTRDWDLLKSLMGDGITWKQSYFRGSQRP